MQDMNAVVEKMKTLDVNKIADLNVIAVRDYSKAERRSAKGEITAIDSAKTNAVYYELEGGSFICVRPSGTEPKLKVYYSLKCKNQEVALENFEKVKSAFEDLMG